MTKQDSKKTLSFKTEVSQLLDLMIHSLYSNRDVFMRELISNSSDALDKLRFSSISNEKLLEGNSDYSIIVRVDKDNKEISIEDNGIGMTEEEVIANIGTIANSGTKKFLENLGKGDIKDSNMIGQFGVGFYSAFMIADQVNLETRKAGEENTQGVLWSSSGNGEFSLQNITKTDKGTKITLHLRDDAQDYLNSWKIKEIITQYSEHIPFKVLMPKKIELQEDNKDANKDVSSKEELESVNSAEALWLKPPREVKKADYEAFYKTLSHDYESPLTWMHNRVEGSLEYSSLLYIPQKAPFDLFDRDQKRGLKLYVKRVFIMDDADSLLPNWLRFVRGLVDCSDLPLNVSREILQDNKVVRKIRSAVVKRIIDKLSDMAKKKTKDYSKFWLEFGKVIKEGIVEDQENKGKIANLLRFSSTDFINEEVSLKQYIERMKENQEHIYFLCADSYQAAKSSPHLELFKEKGIEVLLLSDRIDEWLTSHLQDFEGKKLHSVNRADDNMEELDKIESVDKTDTAEEIADCAELVKKLKASLGDKVSNVKESKRLRNSPSCIVTDDNQMTHNMQKIMQAMGQEMKQAKPILEINPSHKLIVQLSESKSDNIDDWAQILLDQALLAEGAQLENPGEFVSLVNRLLSQ